MYPQNLGQVSHPHMLRNVPFDACIQRMRGRVARILRKGMASLALNLLMDLTAQLEQTTVPQLRS